MTTTPQSFVIAVNNARLTMSRDHARILLSDLLTYATEACLTRQAEEVADIRARWDSGDAALGDVETWLRDLASRLTGCRQ